MRIVFYIIQIMILVVLLLFVGRTTISFSPFRFSIERPFLIAGFVLAFIAGYCLYFDGYKGGYTKGCNDVLNLMEKEKKVHDKKNGDLHELSKGNVKMKIKEP